MPTLLAKVAAIKKALSIETVEPRMALDTAFELMGASPQMHASLPQMADQLIDAIGCTVEDTAEAGGGGAPGGGEKAPAEAAHGPSPASLIMHKVANGVFILSLMATVCVWFGGTGGMQAIAKNILHPLKDSGGIYNSTAASTVPCKGTPDSPHPRCEIPAGQCFQSNPGSILPGAGAHDDAPSVVLNVPDGTGYPLRLTPGKRDNVSGFTTQKGGVVVYRTEAIRCQCLDQHGQPSQKCTQAGVGTTNTWACYCAVAYHCCTQVSWQPAGFSCASQLCT